MTTMIDVIIPARNEADTIGPVVEAFRKTEGIGQIIVVSNGPNSEPTADVAAGFGASKVLWNLTEGKGQAIHAGLPFVTTETVCLCDADLTGLSPAHVTQFARDDGWLTIGVPGFPDRSPVPWPVPMHTFALMAGQRSLPTSILRGIPLHGYTVEAFINRACEQADVSIRLVHLAGVKGKIRNNPKRMEELRRDRKWLQNHW